MNDFSDFGIEVQKDEFVGDSIKIMRILNRRIKVHKYEVNETKFKDASSRDCLKLQIEIDGEKRIVFTGSRYLLEAIVQVPPDRFPFNTTIMQKEKSFKFT